MRDLENIFNFNEQMEQINALLQNPEGIRYLKENFEKIKKLILSKPGDNRLNGFNNFIRSLKDIPEFQEEYDEYAYWADLYDEIKIQDYNVDDPIDVFKLDDKEIKKLIIANEGKSIKNRVFRDIILTEDSVSREEKKLILQEKAQGGEYEFRSCGSTSLIIQTGDLVIKLGLGRRKYEVPYHPRIMMPYFRKRYNDGTCLEIFDYGDVESADITDEKLLEIYKEFEDAGIMWGDASKRNLLVLLKDNNLPDYIASEEFNVFGFLEDSRYPTNHHVPLKAGDFVVCDLDMLYVKGDPAFRYGDIDEVIEEYIISKEREAEKAKKEDIEER